MIDTRTIKLPEHHVLAEAQKTARGKTPLVHIVPEMFEDGRYWGLPSGKALCRAHPGSGWTQNISREISDWRLCAKCMERSDKKLEAP